MPITINGTGTISGVSATGLSSPQTVSRTALPSGSVLQVVSTTKSDTFSAFITTGNFASITGLTASITPSNTLNKILIMWSINSANDLGTANPDGAIQLTRDGNGVGIGDASSNRPRLTQFAAAEGDANRALVLSGSFMDSPNSVASLTYGMRFFNGWGSNLTWYLNRTANDVDNNLGKRLISTITLMEIAG